MQKPKVDDSLTLLTDFGKTEAICAEVLADPTREEGILLKVLARGPFQEGDQKLARRWKTSSSKPSIAK